MSAENNILLESGTNELEIVEFYIGNQYFGVNVAKVREIIRYVAPTRMPESHPAVMGTIKHRDEIIPLVDLTAYLSYAASVEHENSKYIIMEFNLKTYAFRVDDVNRIIRLSWKQIAPPPKLFNTGTESVITGIVKMDDRNILLLDFEKIAVDISGADAMDIIEDGTPQTNVKEKSEFKIMISEDSAMLRKLLISNLKKAGFTNLKVYENGELLWNALQELEPRLESSSLNQFVDIVITDIEMPQMDGFHLCKRIKNSAVFSSLPVIFFSSLISKEVQMKCEKVGGSAAISKPDIKLLVKNIEEYLQIGE